MPSHYTCDFCGQIHCVCKAAFVVKNEPKDREKVSDPITKNIIKRLTDRHKCGMNTYGMTMADNPGDVHYWIDNTIEELLDAVQYLERLKTEIVQKQTKS